MEEGQIFQRSAEFFVFFLNNICTISGGVVVSMLQETCGFAYGMAETLLSLMSTDNLLTDFTPDMLPTKIGIKKIMVLLTVGYGTGYLIMRFSGWMLVLMLGFFLVGIAKGNTINTCTILVADNLGDCTKSMNIMHSCYALGALSYPLFIGAVTKAGNVVPMLVLASCGFPLWLTFCVTPAETKAMKKDRSIDKGFPRNKKSWLLTGLLSYQNTAEASVTGWIVAYFRGSGIISSSLSPYTVTVMWGVTLIARLLIVFVILIKNNCSAIVKMGIGCIIFYLSLMMTGTQTAAILSLLAFTFAMVGMNSTAVVSAGCIISAASVGIMLPAVGGGAIIILQIIDMVAEHAGIEIRMASNVIPYVGMLLFSVAVKRLKEQEL